MMAVVAIIGACAGISVQACSIFFCYKACALRNGFEWRIEEGARVEEGRVEEGRVEEGRVEEGRVQVCMVYRCSMCSMTRERMCSQLQCRQCCLRNCNLLHCSSRSTMCRFCTLPKDSRCSNAACSACCPESGEAGCPIHRRLCRNCEEMAITCSQGMCRECPCTHARCAMHGDPSLCIVCERTRANCRFRSCPGCCTQRDRCHRHFGCESCEAQADEHCLEGKCFDCCSSRRCPHSHQCSASCRNSSTRRCVQSKCRECCENPFCPPHLLNQQELDSFRKEWERKRFFGEYRCRSCRRRWCSAHTYKGWRQKCRNCDIWTYAHTFNDVKPSEADGREKRPHDKEGCERCQSGTPCMK